MRHVIILLVAMVALVGAQIPIRSWYIHVINGLSNDVTLFVQCKSRKYDFGFQDLGSQRLAHGADFQWNFTMNILETNLIWCLLAKPGASIAFPVFWLESKNSWLHQRCINGRVGTCFWTAKDDGIYLRNIPANVDELVHKGWLATLLDK